MYAQLGNIRFEGLKRSINDYSKSDGATFGQLDLINGKPRLQATGNNLEQLSLSVRLRADFTNVEQDILSFKKCKDEFEILPLMLGNGRYLGDFIITEIGETIITAFDDGSILDAMVQITLLEFAVTDRLQQEQNADRKRAFGIGDKRPNGVITEQVPTTSQLAVADLSEIKAQAFVLDQQSAVWENNLAQRPEASNRLSDALHKMRMGCNLLFDKINAGSIAGELSAVVPGLNSILSAIQDFELPVENLASLQLNNRTVQAAIKSFRILANVFANPVILRVA